MDLVLGLGLGIWILAALWSVALLSCFVIARSTGTLRTVSLALFFVIAIVSVILLTLPIDSADLTTNEVILIDNYFLLRIIFIIVGISILLATLGFIFVTDIMVPVHAKRL